MGDARAVRRDAVPLGGREVDGVGEQRPAPQEPHGLVDAQVVGRVGVVGQHGGALVGLLGEVRLEEEPVRVREAGGVFQQGAGAAQGEAGGDGELEAPAVVAVPAGGEAVERGEGLGARHLQGLGAALVHQGRAGEGAQAGGGERLGGTWSRPLVRGRVHRGRRGPRGGEGGDELGGDSASVLLGGEAGLLGEDGALEPGEERRAGVTDDPGLGVVDVGVDEAGHEHGGPGDRGPGARAALARARGRGRRCGDRRSRGRASSR